MNRIIALTLLFVLTFIFGCSTGGLTDIDGNRYKTVQIGNQLWMAENLKTTRYSNGDEIPNVMGTGEWGRLKTAAWANYNRNSSHNRVYGKLYNWYAVEDSRGLCPSGWHVPTDEEWTALTDFLGVGAGGQMKIVGTKYWELPHVGATNESGFSALPGGYRYKDGSFNLMGNNGFWWSSTESSINGAKYRFLSTHFDYILQNYLFDLHTIGANKGNGFSVRCLLD